MQTDYFSVKLFSEKHPVFTEYALRMLIFNSGSNGLAASGAIVRVGRRVLLNEQKFFSWIESGAAAQK